MTDFKNSRALASDSSLTGAVVPNVRMAMGLDDLIYALFLVTRARVGRERLLRRC